MIKFLPLLAFIATLAACSNGPPLASCKGPIFQLNADHWQTVPASSSKSTAGNG